MSIGRPKALRGPAAAGLFDPASDAFGKADAGAAAAALQLRLVRGLARVAGGDLGMTATAFLLLLPAAR